MESFNRLHRVLSSLRSTSADIVNKAVSILEEIEDDDNELIENILDEVSSSIDEVQIVDSVARYIGKITRDAKKVLSGLEDFATVVVEGERSIERTAPGFFQQIWFGDMYDRSGVEGLEVLLEDLKQQRQHLEETFIIKSVSKTITNNNEIGRSYPRSESDSD